MKDLLFLAADLWMIFVGYFYGLRFIRHYGNYLLGIEWMIVATSGSNFLVWSFLGAHEESPLYDLAYFFDAFSRSVGITLILVMGLLAVTHRWKPSVPVDVAIFAVGSVAAFYLKDFHLDSPDGLEGNAGATAVATLYLVANLATSVFLGWFVTRVWRTGLHSTAVATGLVTLAGTTIAVVYDFFPLPFDDADRTIFYTAALATWGTQGFVYFLAYRRMHEALAPVAAPTQEPTHA